MNYFTAHRNVHSQLIEIMVIQNIINADLGSAQP